MRVERLRGSFARRHLGPLDEGDIHNGFGILVPEDDEDPARRTNGGEIPVRHFNGLAAG